MIEKTGVPTKELVDSITPSCERRAKGAVAVIECFQDIPCNPCYTACNKKAIKELIDINDRPELNEEICNGCGVCIHNCPGLAIVVVDESYSDTESLIKIPYEFLPLPSENTYVTGLNRSGNPVCRAKVIKVLAGKSVDKTAIVTLAVPKDLSMEVRFFKEDDFYTDNTIICRCEEITLGEVRDLISKGYTTIDEIKRLSRAGMGPCQGRTCRQLIMQEISNMTGEKPADMRMSTFRPPAKPIKLGLLLGGDSNE